MNYRRIRMTLGLLALLCAAVGPGMHTASAEDKRLFIYNWSDFIGPNTIAKFEKLTGIKVTYDIYDAEETMEARLMAGSSGYDVVSASTDFFSREIKAGVYVPLDKSKLPNWKNLDPRILAIQAGYDPGNRARRTLPAFHQWLRI
jgi:putrescine transport system substrate-binding protein